MIKQLTARIDGTSMDDEEIIEAILQSRGIDDLSAFLAPTEDDMVDFDELIGLHEAYVTIEDAITMGEKFLVLADVDVDGCSANAIMVRYLRARGADVQCVINQGKEHGAENFDLELLKDVDVMIIVDSINNDPAVYEKILSTGVRLCVFDHHIPERRLLESDLPFVLVSSANYYPNKELSGAGVALKYVLYADHMNLEDYANELNLWLYGAFGLVADMTSMNSPENRYIVYRGLKYYDHQLIKKVVGSYAFDSTAISFSVAPLVNAAMRIGQNTKAMELFLTDDEDEMDALISDLRGCRELQNNIVAELMDNVVQQAEDQLDRKCMFFMLPNDVDASVSGLVANKLLSQYQRPLFVLREKIELDDETGEIIKHEYSGSMRAIGVEDMLDIANQTGLCVCQGHPLASGAFIDVDKFEDFKIAIEDVLTDVEFSVKVEADIEIYANQVNEYLIRQLSAINRISGADFEPVTVLIRSDDYQSAFMSGGKHSKFIDNDSGLLLVSWNDRTWESAPQNGEIVGVGTLSKVRYGRNNYLQLTMSDYDFYTTK